MRRITTQNEFAYDVLHNLLIYNTVIVNKVDVNRALSNIVGRLRDDIRIQDRGDTILIGKNPDFDYRVVFDKCKY